MSHHVAVCQDPFWNTKIKLGKPFQPELDDVSKGTWLRATMCQSAFALLFEGTCGVPAKGNQQETQETSTNMVFS